MTPASSPAPASSENEAAPFAAVHSIDKDENVKALGVRDDHSHSPAQSVAMIGRIKALSERIFPGPVTIDYACDPEDPSNEYIVFDVVADGGFKDYREREYQWHDEVEKIVPGVLSEFRLCVHPKP